MAASLHHCHREAVIAGLRARAVPKARIIRIQEVDVAPPHFMRLCADRATPRRASDYQIQAFSCWAWHFDDGPQVRWRHTVTGDQQARPKNLMDLPPIARHALATVTHSHHCSPCGSGCLLSEPLLRDRGGAESLDQVLSSLEDRSLPLILPHNAHVYQSHST